MYAIKAENIVKQYKNGVMALDGLTLTVKMGEIFSLLGPNGAGKSTLIKLLTTFAIPSSGNITMLDRTVQNESMPCGVKLPVYLNRHLLTPIYH